MLLILNFYLFILLNLVVFTNFRGQFNFLNNVVSLSNHLLQLNVPESLDYRLGLTFLPQLRFYLQLATVNHFTQFEALFLSLTVNSLMLIYLNLFDFQRLLGATTIDRFAAPVEAG